MLIATESRWKDVNYIFEQFETLSDINISANIWNRDSLAEFRAHDLLNRSRELCPQVTDRVIYIENGWTCNGEICGGPCNASVWQPIVKVSIRELPESPWPGVGNFHTSMGLGWRMVKEIDLKRTMADIGDKQWFESQSRRTQSDPLSEHGMFLVQSVIAPVRHSSDIKQKHQKM